MFQHYVFFRFSLNASALLLLMGVSFGQLAIAGVLEPVTGVNYNGKTITWDVHNNAQGYNIYHGTRYLNTVVGETAYKPESAGKHWVVAFDGNGNFGSLVESGSNYVNIESVGELPNERLNVQGTVYSNSAGELFWQNTSTGIVEYEVFVNSEAVGTTTGSSFWLGLLPTNAVNQVSVNNKSNRQQLASLLFDTRASSYPRPATNTGTNASVTDVAQPQNARIEVYSSTAAELFWDRPAASALVISTDVFRNNELIGTSLGNSFYDDTRTPNTAYTYALIAKDANGAESQATTINPTMSNDDNEETILSLLAGISQVTAIGPELKWAPLLSALVHRATSQTVSSTETDLLIDVDALMAQLVEQSNELVEEGTVRRIVYDCPEGAVTTESGIDSVFAWEDGITLSFDKCSFNANLQIDGVFVRRVYDAKDSYSDYDQLSVLENGIEYTFNGVVENLIQSGGVNVSTVYNAFSYTINRNLESDVVLYNTNVLLNQEFEESYFQSPYHRNFTTRFTVSAPWTQGRSLLVTTTTPFNREGLDGKNYTVGSLSAEFETGERLILTADTGDANTWYAEFLTTEGSTSITGNWSEMIRLPCIAARGGEC